MATKRGHVNTVARASFGHYLRQANRLCQRDLGTRVARLGLSVGQSYALRALWERDGLTQIELADAAGIAGPAMVTAVRTLLSQGFVSRQRPKDDKHKYIITLTDEDRTLRVEGLRASVESNSRALDGVSSNDVRIALGVLHRVRKNSNGALVDHLALSKVDLLIGP